MRMFSIENNLGLYRLSIFKPYDQVLLNRLNWFSNWSISQNHLEGSLNNRYLGCFPPGCDSVSWKYCLQFHIFKKLPGDADVYNVGIAH